MKGIVFDLDGLLWVAGAPLPSASHVLETLRRSGVPFCVLTNDCSTSRAMRASTLQAAGLHVEADQLLTPAVIAAGALRAWGIASIAYLGATRTRADLEPAVEIRASGKVDAVVVGDLFDSYERAQVELAVNQIVQGASFLALQRKPFWSDGKNSRRLDVGFWVSAFEAVTGITPVVVGKPSSFAYEAAVAALRLTVEETSDVLMVSDDHECDLRGAHDVGMRTLLVAPQTEPVPSWVGMATGELSEVLPMLGLT